MDVILEAVREAARLIASGDPYLLGVLALSLQVSGVATLVGAAVGIPVGITVALTRFPGRGLAVTLIHTGFALPPVAVGLAVYLLLSRTGPFGSLAMLYSPGAMIAAQVVIAAPYVAGITLAAVQAVPDDARLQARALGASRARALAAHLREARLGIGAAVVAGFGSVFSEVGAVMIVGGNISEETRVLTTAIVLETRRGNFAIAIALALLLLAIAFAVNLLITRFQQGRVSPGPAAARAPSPP
ncbi:MAG: ABC transporter permease [Longimicrobiales bacterium]